MKLNEESSLGAFCYAFRGLVARLHQKQLLGPSLELKQPVPWDYKPYDKKKSDIQGVLQDMR